MSKFLKFIVNIFLICAILIAAAILIPPLAGIQTTIVDTASMDTNLPLGSITYSTDVDASEIEVGDEVLKDNNTSTYAYIVKEVNQSTDSFTVVNAMDQDAETEEITLRNSVPKVAVVVPYIGYVIIAMHSTEGIIILALVVVLIIILFILSELWKEKPEEEDEEEDEPETGKKYSFLEEEASSEKETEAAAESGSAQEIQDAETAETETNEPQSAPSSDEEEKEEPEAPEQPAETEPDDQEEAEQPDSDSRTEVVTSETDRPKAGDTQEIRIDTPFAAEEADEEDLKIPELRHVRYNDTANEDAIPEIHLQQDPKYDQESDIDLSEAIEQATKDAEEQAEKDAAEKAEKAGTSDAENGWESSYIEETPDTEEPEKEEEEPEQFVPVEHATLDELLDQAKKAGDDPDVSKDEATGITVVDYSGVL